ncbi:NAD(P)/FAD-dependent oxidoreductase [Piscinibacter koreensis]|uniref:FAD-dependent monooxygenase n=1 Tax=Piscinibacter koreensis TaxID=2742824 RepID=A0A7Y6TY43_9BURK|nr:FAD-dependent monooxygenase [Schlegelella koreensis]NUZ07804.1 FAD-dependent monooxygenase [Schlegelella koreensis]
MQRFDAAIVGAGPAGGSLATLLARAGWSVALIERQAFPRRKVCGECIAATNLPLLDALGVGRVLRERAGAELRRVALWRGDADLVAALPRAEGAAPYGRALGREHLDTLIADAAEAAGATRLQPWALRDLAGTPGAYRLRLAATGAPGAQRAEPVPRGDGAGTAHAAGEPVDRAEAPAAGESRDIEIEAGLVVAAHGSWEPLPSERAARRATRRPSDLFAFKANFRDAALAHDLLPVLAFPGGYGGMVVADDGIATLACCIREDALERARSAAARDGGGAAARAGSAVEALLRRECRGVAAALGPAHRAGSWLASGPIRPGVRLGQGDGVFRIGNAAGEAHPIVGEGISMALQSAFLLASLIGSRRRELVGTDAATVQRRALAGYEARWRERFARRLQVAAAFAHVAMRPWAASLAWPAVARWPGVLTHGARWSGKTRCAPEAAALAATLG